MSQEAREPVCAHYEILIQGYLDERWAGRFQGLSLSRLPGGISRLQGPVADQAALHGILGLISDLGLQLLLVKRMD